MAARTRSIALGLALLICGCARVPATMPEAIRATESCQLKLDQGDLLTAESYCSRAIDLSPKYPDAWTVKGLLMLKKGWLKDAQKAFVEAVTLNDKDARAQNGLGVIAYLGKHYDYAEGQFRHAVDLKPSYDAARYNLALDYFADRALRRAKESVEAILHRDAKAADAYFFLATFRLYENAPDEALTWIKKALLYDPTRTVYWMCLGDIYNALHRYEDAEYALTSCLEIDRKDENCTENLARLKARDELLTPPLGAPRP